MKKMHNIQLNILEKLLFAKSLKHSQIRDESIPNSQLKFHLDELIKDNLIEKTESGYVLTSIGKEYANTIETEKSSIIKQAKVTAVMCCTRTISKQTEYLIYLRLKNPFFGCQGFPTEKVRYGENLYNAAKRGLSEETNLIGEPLLFGIRHYTVYDENRTLLEDKIMYLFKFINPEGELIGNAEGDFSWIKESDIENFVRNPLEEFQEIYTLFKNYSGQLTLEEISQTTNKF